MVPSKESSSYIAESEMKPSNAQPPTGTTASVAASITVDTTEVATSTSEVAALVTPDDQGNFSFDDIQEGQVVDSSTKGVETKEKDDAEKAEDLDDPESAKLKKEFEDLTHSLLQGPASCKYRCATQDFMDIIERVKEAVWGMNDAYRYNEDKFEEQGLLRFFLPFFAGQLKKMDDAEKELKDHFPVSSEGHKLVNTMLNLVNVSWNEQYNNNCNLRRFYKFEQREVYSTGDEHIAPVEDVTALSWKHIIDIDPSIKQTIDKLIDGHVGWSVAAKRIVVFVPEMKVRALEDKLSLLELIETNHEKIYLKFESDMDEIKDSVLKDNDPPVEEHEKYSKFVRLVELMELAKSEFPMKTY